jgi:hypothetical protein
MTRGSSERDTVWYDMHMLVLYIWLWPRGDVLGLWLTDRNVGLLRGVDCDILV